MKKVLTTCAAVVLATTMMTGCGSTPNSGNGGSGGNAVTGDTIKIGVNYELSGNVATYGQTSAQGVELAIDELNAAGGLNGKKYEIVKYDNKSETAEATTLANKLVSSDGVVAMIGPATSGGFQASLPIAEKNKVPAIAGAATADKVLLNANGSVNPYAYRVCFADSYQGAEMAKWAVSKGYKNVAIYKDVASDYGKGLAEAFKTELTKNGGTVVVEESYNSGDTDFNAVLTRLKAQSFDALYVPGYYSEAGLIIKQARELGITVPILGSDGFDSPVLGELAGETLTNVFYSNHYSSLSDDERVQKFITSYKGKYNADPSAFAALAYDAMMFVHNGLSQASELNSVALQKALAETKNFQGVTGKFSLDDKHNAVKSIYVIEIQDGKEVSAVQAG